jgi:nitrite reductase (NADH) large subunit
VRPRGEPEYLHLKLRKPASAWPLARAVSLAAMAALVAVLLERPALGLRLLWEVAVPLLPLVFLLAPGLWRNLCPMAAANQLPRVLGITRARPLPPWLERHGYAIGLLLFFGIASSRKAGLADDAQAVALVLGGALALPLLGGLAFRGKSGFCGSVCPLRAAQAVYGQTPVAKVENSHCKPCVGCTTNCSDLKPDTALRDELADAEGPPARYLRLFAGAFPGFVLAFYTLPDASEVGVAGLYSSLGLYMLASLGSFALLQAVTGTVNQ